MHTSRLPTVCISVVTTKCQYQLWGGRVGLQVNKFEQVYSVDHQMSVAGGRGYVLCLVSRGGDRSYVWCSGERKDPISQCINDLVHIACIWDFLAYAFCLLCRCSNRHLCSQKSKIRRK